VGIGAAEARWMKRRRDSGDDGFMVTIESWYGGDAGS
jgi:hypothetical protein